MTPDADLYDDSKERNSRASVHVTRKRIISYSEGALEYLRGSS